MMKQRPAARTVTCSWCGSPVPANVGRMRLHESETVRFSGHVLATFHPECGDALLDLCEQRGDTRKAAT